MNNWGLASIGCYECFYDWDDEYEGLVVKPNIENDIRIGFMVNDCLYSSEETDDYMCPYLYFYDEYYLGCEMCVDHIP
jgi:hypothetical protein